MPKTIKNILLLIIVVLAIVLRTYKINNPVADWHSWRQADTASVTREYVKHGINLLLPTYHDLSNIPSGKDNPQGYRMVEFPIINGLTAAIITNFHLQPQEVVVGRWVSISFSVITLISLFYLGTLLSGSLTGFIAALTFAILPYSVYYSRVILPEPVLIALSTLSILLFALWLKHKNFLFFIFALIIYALSLLVKPYALFLAPVFLALVIWSKQYFKIIAFAFFGAISVIPLFFWRRYIVAFPAGIPASDWLYNKDNIRFKGAFFHWLFEVRLGNLILGVGGFVPFVLGLLKKGQDYLIYLTWGACLLAYLTIFAGGNVQHDYYQILLLPFICLCLGRGISFLWELTPAYVSRLAFVTATVSLLGFAVFVSWYTIRGYYQINNYPIVEAGQAVDKLTPADAKVIAPYFGDTAFLFQTNRTGWPIGYDIDQKIKMGATTYVSVVYDDEARALEKLHPVLAKTDHYIIIDLSK